MNNYQRFLKMNVTSSSYSIMSPWQFSSPQYHIICQPVLFVFSIGGKIQKHAESSRINRFLTCLRSWGVREKSRKYLESLQGSSISLGEQQSTYVQWILGISDSFITQVLKVFDVLQNFSEWNQQWIQNTLSSYLRLHTELDSLQPFVDHKSTGWTREEC